MCWSDQLHIHANTGTAVIFRYSNVEMAQKSVTLIAITLHSLVLLIVRLPTLVHTKLKTCRKVKTTVEIDRHACMHVCFYTDPIVEVTLQQS